MDRCDPAGPSGPTCSPEVHACTTAAAMDGCTDDRCGRCRDLRVSRGYHKAGLVLCERCYFRGRIPLC